MGQKGAIHNSQFTIDNSQFTIDNSQFTILFSRQNKKFEEFPSPCREENSSKICSHWGLISSVTHYLFLKRLYQLFVAVSIGAVASFEISKTYLIILFGERVSSLFGHHHIIAQAESVG